MSTFSDSPSAAITVEVRYAETDQMGVVHHAVYPVWLELARTQLCRQSGFSYAEIEASGYFLMVTGLDLEFRKAARYPDRVTTHCRLERYASRGLTFGYEVRAHDALLARGTTDHVWLEVSTRKPCRIPDHLAQPFAALLADAP